MASGLLSIYPPEHTELAGQIAQCLAELVTLDTPTVSVLLGQGSGGPALAMVPADRVLAALHGWLAPLPPEKLDASYQKVTIDWRGDMLGARTDFYLKRFATDGKLAFCGVRDGERTGTYA